MKKFIDLTKTDTKIYSGLRILESHKSKKDYSNYKLITFDIETWGLVPENLALAIFYDGLNYIICYTKEEILNYLDSLNVDSMIYAHNGFNFDYNLFIEDVLIQKMNFSQKGGVKFLRYVNKNSKEIVFKDSVYILPGKLADLGKSFANGEYKGITPEKFIDPFSNGFNRTKFLEDSKTYNIEHLDEEDIEYCKQDCLVLYEILQNEEVLKLDYKNFNTIAKIANHKMLTSIKPLTILNRFDFQFKKLYSGGLTSVFKHEAKGKIGTFDVNSMYPKAMVSYFAEPTKFNEYYFEDCIDEIVEKWFNMLQNFPNGKSILTIRLKENTPKKIIDILKRTPLIPNYKTHYYDMFDFNEYKIEIMNVELSNLLHPLIKDYFELKPIYSLYCDYKDLIYPFKEFIEFHYNERLKYKKDKPSYAQILKLIMNSSYGYFAMQVDGSEYLYGTENEIAFKIEKILNEKGFEFRSFQDFKKDYEIVEVHGSYEYDIKNIYDYFYYIKDMLGEFEDFQLKTLNEVNLEGAFTNQYVLYYSTNKRIVEDKTSFYIASEITSKSRAYLGKLALEVAFSGNNVCYCDTDSLHIEILKEKALYKAIDKYLDNNILGMMKNEGVFEYGVWFSKKHYYLFKEVNKKLVLTKDALKGFAAAKPVDRLIYEQDVVNVAKMGSRIKNVSFETNNISKGKNFLNFVVSRKRDGSFFHPLENSMIDVQKHKKELKKFYFEFLEKGLFVPNNFIKEEDIEKIKLELKKYGMKQLTPKLIQERIEEIRDYHRKNSLIGVYDSLASLKLLPLEQEKELARNVLKIIGNYRLNKKIKVSDEELRANKKKVITNKNSKYFKKKKDEKLDRKATLNKELMDRLNKIKS